MYFYFVGKRKGKIGTERKEGTDQKLKNNEEKKI